MQNRETRTPHIVVYTAVQQHNRYYNRWSKCNRALGNAVVPPTENVSWRSPTSYFLGTQANGRGTPSDTESALTVVPGYNIFCISNASQSDRAKSKLEYCGATRLRKRFAMGARDHAQQRGPQRQTGAHPRVYSFPISNFSL